VNLKDSNSDPIIFFDGICNLCNASVDFVMRHDKQYRFKFASLQSKIAKDMLLEKGINLDDLESIILYKKGQIKQKSNAVLSIAWTLGFPFSLGYVFKLIPRFLRNYVYDVIARNRYKWFGKKSICRLPTPEEQKSFLS
jgi:predicted DCC family thiol-disulfide oxidoreductase YuxK